MTLLFSNATVLPMTDPCDASRTLTGWVGVVGNRVALVTASADRCCGVPCGTSRPARDRLPRAAGHAGARQHPTAMPG